jgi:hypothetical protein
MGLRYSFVDATINAPEAGHCGYLVRFLEVSPEPPAELVIDPELGRD